MIKINLLPPYFIEREVVRRLIVAFGVVLLVVIVGEVGWLVTKSNALADKTTELQRTKEIEQQALTTKKQAEEERAKIAPIQAKVKFIEDIMDYNTKAPALYEELARYTYEKIYYRSIDLTDAQMTVDAYAPSLSDAGRYLLNLYRATHIFSQVSMTGIPEYSSKDDNPTFDINQIQEVISSLQADPQKAMSLQSRIMSAKTDEERIRIAMALFRAKKKTKSTAFNFKVVCTLAQPLSAPSYSGGAAAAAPGAVGVPGGGVAPPAGMPAPTAAPAPVSPSGEPTGPSPAAGRFMPVEPP